MHPKRGDDAAGSWAETRPSFYRPEWGALVNEIWLGDGGVPALAAATLTTGDSGVGKSSLLLRFSDDSFDMNCTPTIGSLCWLSSSFVVIPVCVCRSPATYRSARGVCVTTVRPASVDRD